MALRGLVLLWFSVGQAWSLLQSRGLGADSGFTQGCRNRFQSTLTSIAGGFSHFLSRSSTDPRPVAYSAEEEDLPFASPGRENRAVENMRLNLLAHGFVMPCHSVMLATGKGLAAHGKLVMVSLSTLLTKRIEPPL